MPGNMWGQQERKRTDSNLTLEVLSHFANFKLAGDRAVRDVSETLSSLGSSSSAAGSSGRNAANTVSNRPRRRRRRGTYARRRLSSRRIGALTDADLEAELASRRAQRARERDRYARAMRSEKLQVLESELNALRSKIGNTRSGGAISGGTPPNPRWESLNARRHSGDRAPSLNSSALKRGPPGTPAPVNGAGPPPPPPLGGLRDPNDEEPEIDPEVQKREKAERQRRREAKRKEREANKKPLTLAEIIKSAGKNPIARLKPKGAIATVDVDDPNPEPIAEMVQVTLKKVEKEVENPKPEEPSELEKAFKKGGTSKEDGAKAAEEVDVKGEGGEGDTKGEGKKKASGNTEGEKKEGEKKEEEKKEEEADKANEQEAVEDKKSKTGEPDKAKEQEAEEGKKTDPPGKAKEQEAEEDKKSKMADKAEGSNKGPKKKAADMAAILKATMAKVAEKKGDDGNRVGPAAAVPGSQETNKNLTV